MILKRESLTNIYAWDRLLTLNEINLDDLEIEQIDPNTFQGLANLKIYIFQQNHN